MSTCSPSPSRLLGGVESYGHVEFSLAIDTLSPYVMSEYGCRAKKRPAPSSSSSKESRLKRSEDQDLGVQIDWYLCFLSAGQDYAAGQLAAQHPSLPWLSIGLEPPIFDLLKEET